MAGFVVRRLIAAVLVLFLTSLGTFALFFKSPVDPAANVCHAKENTCTDARMAQLTHEFGRDRSVWSNYVQFLGGLVHDRTIVRDGTPFHCDAPCLDISMNVRGQEVSKEFVKKYPATFSLAIGGGVFILLFGVTTGVLAARFRGTWFDKAAVGVSIVISSIPYYVLALIAYIFLVLQFNIFPNTGYHSIANPAKWFWSLLLPWFMIGIWSASSYVRYTRGQMLESMGEDYIRSARAKGIGVSKVLFKHALRVAIVPVVTIFGLELAVLMSGTIFTEFIFNIDGIGRWTLQSIHGPYGMDFPIMNATVLILAVVIVASTLIVDLLYAVLDPRVRLS